MLTCLPRSICSWDYRVTGVAGGPAILTFNHWTEQGTITIGHTSYDVVKHGPLSGRWTLEHAGEVVVEAHKPSALFRSFVLQGPQTLTLEAQSPFGRTFELSDAGGIVGTIAPMHPFTRRATIDCAACDEPTLLLAFWLVALTWRRRARSNNAGPG